MLAYGLKSVGFAALVLSVACGDSGDTGAGAAGGSTSAGGATSTGGSTSSGMLMGCAALCAARDVGGCGLGQDCVANCEKHAGPNARCGAEHDALVECILANDVCGSTELDCDVTTYSLCLNGSSCRSDCTSVPSGPCGCEVTCGTSMIETDCTRSGVVLTCTCVRDGATIGRCKDVADEGAICGYESSCCDELLAPP
jgi:hypothetical protein